MTSRYFSISAAAVLPLLFTASSVHAQEADQITVDALQNAHPVFHSPKFPAGGTPSKNARLSILQRSAQLSGIDSIVNFTGSFTAAGFDANNNPQNQWTYAMVGSSPTLGGTTYVNAPLFPVSILLLNADGTPRFVNGQLLYSDVTKYVAPTLESPIFSNFTFTSSTQPTQFTDAVYRAEFFHKAPANWHTRLVPHVKTPRVMAVPYGSYQFSLNADGTCCNFILIDQDTFGKLFLPQTMPATGQSIVGAAELSGDMTTKDIATFLFPNVFLYANGDPNQCCELGFHTVDMEPGDAKNGNLPRLFPLIFAPWITAGNFGPAQDIVALSHEMAESFNDPFLVFDGIHNLTPWWSSGGICQDNLEVGDVTETLPNALGSITGGGVTYHPQNVALLQWLEFQSPSTAIDGAYSYPDETVLTALSPVEHENCN